MAAVFEIEKGILMGFRGEGDVAVPEGVTGIRPRAFLKKAVTEVSLPQSLESLPGKAFFGCKALKRVILDNPRTKIDPRAFDNCPAEVYFGDGRAYRVFREGCTILEGVVVEYRGQGEELTIPVGAVKIGPGAFRMCKTLKKLRVPAFVEEMGDHAFMGCENLREIWIEGPETRLGSYSFSHCPATVVFGDGRVYRSYEKIGGCEIIDGCLTGYTGEEGRAVLPEGVRRIGAGVFTETVREVILPASLEGLDGEELPRSIHGGWLILPNGVRIRSSALGLVNRLWRPGEIGGEIFLTEDGVLLEYLGTGGRVRVPEGVTVIGKHAFARWKGIRKMELPESLRAVEAGAFRGCEDLEEITLPRGVRMLGEAVFADCPKLRKVTILGEGEKLPGYLFQYCGALEEVRLNGNVGEIGECAFEGCGNLRVLEGLAEDAVAQTDAFAGCDKLGWYLPGAETGEVEWACSESYQTLGETEKCGCGHCLRLFDPKELWQWAADGYTALCPYCGRPRVFAQFPGKVLGRGALRMAMAPAEGIPWAEGEG